MRYQVFSGPAAEDSPVGEMLSVLGPRSFTFLLELKLEEEMKRISISTIRTITKKTEFVDSIKTASIVPMALKENIQNVLFELKETIFFLRMFQNL